MAIAAVPKYLGTDFSTAAPGHRFGMYLKLWGVNARSNDLLWTTHDVNYRDRVAGQRHEERECRNENKSSAFGEARKLNVSDKQAMHALASRQKALAVSFESAGQLLRLESKAIAPFTTGLGNEHPLENGFAFLNPYGLPYLPGSGVKGVLRKAAEELALDYFGDNTIGWKLTDVWALFGYEAYTGKGHETLYNWAGNPNSVDKDDLSRFLVSFCDLEKERDRKWLNSLVTAQNPLQALLADKDFHTRGTLNFWDVIPQINGDSLKVEVMTPHQSHYYQKDESPHESGSPNPINFLTVPPGSSFVFHVQCNRAFLARITPALAANDRWKDLLQAAFAHAFEWLGFGAKTAVGYGVMRETSAQERAASQAAELQCEWVDDTIKEIAAKNRVPDNKLDEVLRGKPLAEAWGAISNRDLRIKALADIRSRWQLKGWWDSPPPGVASKAKAIYAADNG